MKTGGKGEWVRDNEAGAGALAGMWKVGGAEQGSRPSRSTRHGTARLTSTTKTLESLAFLPLPPSSKPWTALSCLPGAVQTPQPAPPKPPTQGPRWDLGACALRPRARELVWGSQAFGPRVGRAVPVLSHRSVCVGAVVVLPLLCAPSRMECPPRPPGMQSALTACSRLALASFLLTCSWVCARPQRHWRGRDRLVSPHLASTWHYVMR